MMLWSQRGGVRHGLVAFAMVWVGLLCPQGVQAHSSSNSFLTLSASGSGLSLRADVHWRDVDLIFDLELTANSQVSTQPLILGAPTVVKARARALIRCTGEC